MSQATAAVLATAVVALLVLAIVRLAPARHRITVVRRGRVVRTSWGRLAAVVPGLESVRMWPVDPCRLELSVRATTCAGREVRVLVDVTVLLAAQPRGREYDEMCSRLITAAEQRLVATVAAHDELDLVDPAHGPVARALLGLAVPGGSITVVDLTGVELLLHPHHHAGGGCDGDR